MINAWKNNLLSLPDSIFFDIMRNYLGDLKTPFNKHDLMRSLTTMVMKKDVRTRIFELIDEEDAKLLTSVSLLKSPTISELHSFTKNFFSFLELYNKVENLQQRLLLCIEYPEKSGRKEEKVIMLNPMLEMELKESILSSPLVFPSIKMTESAGRQPWYDEQLLTAFISFLSSNRTLLEDNGNKRKKAETKFQQVFSSASSLLPEAGLPQLLLHTVNALGFITVSGTDFSINYDQIRKFGKAGYRERMLRIVSTVIIYNFQEYEADRKPSIETVFRLLSPLLLSFTRGTTISLEDFSSVLFLIKRNLSGSAPETNLISADLVLDSLCLTGYLTETETSLLLNFNPDAASAEREKLKIQSNSEISAPAGFPIADEITAAVCSEIQHCDITRTYSIEKKSFAAALESGLTIDEIISTLEASSAGTIPQNILFSFKAWEKEYRSISLNYGIVMTVSADRLPLIKHSPSLNEFFLASPAPGVFLLDPQKENEWRNAFAEAGFDILPGVVSRNGAASVLSVSDSKTSGIFNMINTEPELIEFYGKKAISGSSTAIIAELETRISRLSIPTESKNKLTARSQKKLILTDSQLKASDRPEERGEAGGLDHRAKIRLTERALELENLLEVTTAKDFELEKKLVKPLKLAKAENIQEGKPPVFIINGIELPEETEVHIPITRISYLKMLKSSLYTP